MGASVWQRDGGEGWRVSRGQYKVDMTWDAWRDTDMEACANRQIVSKGQEKQLIALVAGNGSYGNQLNFTERSLPR